MQTDIDKISQTTGRKPSECSCNTCKMQCQRTPCLGTPDDIVKLVDAGYGKRLAPTMWAAGMIMRVVPYPVVLIAPQFDKEKGACTFYNDGLCELHDLGLKPTEGKLSGRDILVDNFLPDKNISWNVAREWITLADPQKLNKLLEAIKKLC